MPRKPDPPPNSDDPQQSRRFIDMAREVETDETSGATDWAFERVIKPVPPRKEAKVVQER
jgi:hypothetical protein